jgi:hypothetical protein
MDATLGQAAKPNEVVGSKSVRKSGGLSAVTGVANVEIMKMAHQTKQLPQFQLGRFGFPPLAIHK